jgi:hypothetical protein
MPNINVNIQPGGALLSVFIGVSGPRASALMAASQPVPPMASGTFLVDTGASGTCVDPELIRNLGLQATGRVAISTPSTAGSVHYCDQFDVALFIPGNAGIGGHVVIALPVITTHLRSQGIDGLLGRDVLNNCVLIYNGSASILTPAY